MGFRLNRVRRCKYTGEQKFLVELEDRVDDEMLLRLRLEEELAAISGNGFEDDFAFSLHEPSATEIPAEEDAGSKLKLPEFPEITQDLATLGARVKKFKDAAIKRRGIYTSVEDRLKEDQSQGHEMLGCRSAVHAAKLFRKMHVSYMLLLCTIGDHGMGVSGVFAKRWFLLKIPSEGCLLLF